MSFKNIPRLYINKELKGNSEVLVEIRDAHYLKNVLRLTEKKKIRIFNGIDGEWDAIILNRDCKKVRCIEAVNPQIFIEGPSIYFSLIKSNNLRWLLEKSTELGVAELHPIITERSNVRSFNFKKAQLHLKEASEVSERLELPKLHRISTLDEVLLDLRKKSKKVVFCNEARNDTHLSNYFKNNFTKTVSFIVGPEGGFSDKEIKSITKHPNIKSVKIHDRILRAETAVVLVMSIYNNYLVMES
tara:strand:+ start:505 stop:1236 length:732 start_codon:yes stop_codon:yes gene_type:complete